MIKSIKNIYRNLAYMNFLKHNKRVYWKLIKGYIKVNFLKQEQIRFVEIMLTYGCNASCSFCSCRALVNRAGKILTTEKVKSIIDECAGMNVPVVAFLGGEPLLIKDLPEMIAHTKKRGILPGITTNAGLLTKEKLRELQKAGLGFMSVSIHSTDPKEHDNIVKIENAFEHAVEMLKEAKRLGIACNIATVFTRSMFKDGRYKRIVDLARDLNMRLSVNNFVPASQDDLNNPEMLTYEQNQELEKICKENLFVTMHMTNNFFGYGCPIGNCYVGLTAYGDALPCFFVPISFGNIWNDSLKSIFEKMLKVPFFKRRPQMCTAGENKEFIIDYLTPTFGKTKGEPMEVEKHPKFDKNTGTLADLKNPTNRSKDTSF